MAYLTKRLVLSLTFALVVALPSLHAEEATTKDQPAVEIKQTPEGQTSRIRVLVPSAEAQLWFDTILTKSKGLDRSFRCPSLNGGRSYTYKIVASWNENGREVSHETTVTFRGGQDIFIDFRR